MLATARRVRADRLAEGDELADGVYVTERYVDADGLWLAFSDGDEGYISPSRTFALA